MYSVGLVGTEVGFTGLLNADIFGEVIPTIDLSEQSATDPFGQFGSVVVNGDQVSILLNVFSQGGDFSDPILQNGPNAAYSGGGVLAANGVIPAPGTAALAGAGLLLASRRRR